MENWRTIIPKIIPQTREQLYQRNTHFCKSPKAYNRFPNLGIWQRDWEAPGNLTLKASGIWLQNCSRTGETDSWRTKTKLCVHQEPGERSSDPTRDWDRLAYECPGVSSGDRDHQAGALNTTVPGATTCWHNSFWRRSPLAPLLLPQFCHVVRIGKRSPKWRWLKDKEGKAHKNRTKEGPR